jgi:hypothetical protein
VNDVEKLFEGVDALETVSFADEQIITIKYAKNELSLKLTGVWTSSDTSFDNVWLVFGDMTEYRCRKYHPETNSWDNEADGVLRLREINELEVKDGRVRIAGFNNQSEWIEVDLKASRIWLGK